MCREAGLPPAQTRDSIYDELGKVHSDVVALHRELARKKAEVERLNAEINRQARHLEAADLRKNEFLAMLGHELRNPLAALEQRSRRAGAQRPRTGDCSVRKGRHGASGAADGPTGR